MLASRRELWLDESHSALLAGMSLPELLRFVRGDVHPPGYFLTLSLWANIFGDSPASLRGLSVVAAAIATFVVFWLARSAFGARLGVVAALLFGFAPVLVHYGTEVRMYALVVFLGAATLYCYHLAMPDRRGGGGWASAVGVLGGLTFYVHYFAVFFLIGLYLSWLWEVVRRRVSPRPMVLSGLIAAVVIAPWTPVLLEQRSRKDQLRIEEQAGHADATSLSYGVDANPDAPVAATARGLVENLASIFGVYPASNPIILGLLALPLIGAAIALLVSAVLGGFWARLAILVTGVFALAGLGLGFSARRFLILTLTPLVMGTIEGISLLARRAGRSRELAAALALAVTIVVVAGGWHAAREPERHPTQELVGYLRRHAAPADLLVFNAAYYEIPFRYYARHAGFDVPSRGFPIDIRAWWEQQPFKGWGGPVVRESDLESFVHDVAAARGRTVWLILFETRYYDPKDRLLDALSRAALSTEPVEFGGATGPRLFQLTF